MKLLPWWGNYLLWLALGLAVFGTRLKKRLRSADEAEAQRVKAAIAEALAPVEKQLAHAEKLAALFERENEEYQEQLRLAAVREEQKDKRIARFLDDEVEMQKKMANVIGQCAALEERLQRWEEKGKAD